MRTRTPETHQLIAIQKRDPNEVFVIVYNRGQETAAMQCLGRWASNPSLRFTWWDAARLSQRIRKEAENG